jgi:hypothetical protein
MVRAGVQRNRLHKIGDAQVFHQAVNETECSAAPAEAMEDIAEIGHARERVESN